MIHVVNIQQRTINRHDFKHHPSTRAYVNCDDKGDFTSGFTIETISLVSHASYYTRDTCDTLSCMYKVVWLDVTVPTSGPWGSRPHSINTVYIHDQSDATTKHVAYITYIDNTIANAYSSLDH